MKKLEVVKFLSVGNLYGIKKKGESRRNKKMQNKVKINISFYALCQK